MRLKLLSTLNAKTVKGEKRGYLTGILYLAPADESKLGNLCPFASQGCRAACLYTAGRGRFAMTKRARLRKTRMFFKDSARFVDMLAHDVETLGRWATIRHLEPVVRLNGTSDIPWERIKGTQGLVIMDLFPHIQFYDYTKRPSRRVMHPNYHLTFSHSEENTPFAIKELEDGKSVAVVFDVRRSKPLPHTWNGFRVIDADAHDLRFLDPPGVVVGLRAKGQARFDNTGFVVLNNGAQAR